MFKYILLIISYLLFPLILKLFISSSSLVYYITLFFIFIILLYYYPKYKIKFEFKLISIFTGILIFVIWVLLDGNYPLLFNIETLEIVNNFQLTIRFLGFIIITPFVEEIFTRGFLIKYLIKEKFNTVSNGKFTWFSFIGTVLFFGFSHAEWLQGLTAGIMLNLLYYKSKNVSNCILAHSIANILLWIFI